MRVLFMGTPDFAVPALQALLDSRHEVVGVVTQPDKPKGRSGQLQASPVKELAVRAKIPIFQPQRLQDEVFIHTVRSLGPDIIVVVAFGQILSQEILEAPQYGCINAHASLLPKLRGAAPIQWAIIQGEEETGVTVQQMDEGVDTGDILLVTKCRIEPKETGGSLFEKLSKLGGPMILQVLQSIEDGTLHPEPQGEEYTYAKMLSKATGKIDFSRPAAEIERLIRGLNPWPSAYCYLDGKMLKIWEAEVESTGAKESADALPGAVVRVEKDSFLVQTGEGLLRIVSVQLEGKKRMECADFLRGYQMKEQTVLTAEKKIDED